MIRRVLINALLTSGIALWGVYLASAPVNYVRFVVFWFMPIWIGLGVLAGWVLAVSAVKRGEPFFMLPPLSLNREIHPPGDFVEFPFHRIFNPLVYIWGTSAIAGFLQVLMALDKVPTWNYILASFFLGMFAGSLQASIVLLLPILYYNHRVGPKKAKPE